MATWQFVSDMTTASPSVLLDLNASPLWVGDGWELTPPTYNKGRAGSPLRHGQRVTNSVANNRTLNIPLQIVGTSNDNAASVIQSLGLQLRVDNILKVQIGTTNPVFFRTFADPDYALDVHKTLVRDSKIVLQIEAEPFAYSPRVEVTGSPFTLSNNPAAGTNPCFIDIASVQGDVETPLLLIATSTGATTGLVSKWTHVATRRRGTPSNYSNVVQGEAMTTGTDATVTADASMSGGSKMRVSFTTAPNSLRMFDSFPANGTAVADARGEYIVYGRFAKTVAGDTISVQLGYGSSSGTSVLNDAKVLPAGVAGPYWVNLGKVPVPAWSDPIQHGFSGASTNVKMPFVGVWAARTAGSGSLDVDCLYFVPADESTVITKWPSTDERYVLDGTTAEGGSVYASLADFSEVITTSSPAQIVGGGGFPEVIPGATNRVHIIRQVDPAGTVDGITNTTTLRAYYWPRWREPFRP